MINRKFIIVALSLLISGSALASGGITRAVVIPPAKSYGGWFVGASALYLKPTVYF